MRSGDDFLSAVSDDAAELRELDAQRATVRKRLLGNCLEAHGRRKTQQEIAVAAQYSRQRIAQFLAEARSA